MMEELADRFNPDNWNDIQEFQFELFQRAKERFGSLDDCVNYACAMTAFVSVVCGLAKAVSMDKELFLAKMAMSWDNVDLKEVS